MDDQDRYARAKKRVDEIKGFYSHFMVYIFVNAALCLINLLTDPQHLWFYWPLFGWGIGIVAHAFSTFGVFGYFGRDWEERKIKEIMEKERRNDPKTQ